MILVSVDIKPVFLLATALQNLIYLEFKFLIKVKPKKQSLLHDMLAGSFELPSFV